MQRWYEETLYFSGDEYFEKMFVDLAKARRSVDFETYIYEACHLGERLACLLIDLARRGVRVRVIVDGFGSPKWESHYGQRLIDAGVRFKVYHPLFRSLPRAFHKLNHRDHKKVCIIDGRIAWVGSLNVSEKHLTMSQGTLCWRDTGIRVAGEGVNTLNVSFLRAWNRRRWRWMYASQRKAVEVHRENLLLLKDSPALRRRTHLDVFGKIVSAERRIWATTAYFVPTLSLIKALKFAASNGVDVRLLLPRTSDVFFIPWISRIFYRTLLRSGVRIYEYGPRFIHAKSLIIDDWAVVGSSNLNYRSFLHDLEVDVVVTHPENRERLSQQFLEDLEQTQEVRLVSTTWTAWIGHLLHRWRYWM
ncbi:MAG: phosphatidylserine/phosphatidylglycerophosphate/cardiolipin synthase family protein [Bacteriovoracia bacterium]